MEVPIIRTINTEVQDFKTKAITLVPGLIFNQYEMIQKIYFYYNSKFTSGEVDEDGDRKYFLNIVKNPCKVFSKAIDFDTKNIRLLTAGGGDPLKTWFMERDLKYWMRNQQFGKTLNRIFKELPIFGSHVLKIVDGKPYHVDLRNFVVDASADDLDSSGHIIEIHHMIPATFRKAAKQMGWDSYAVDETIGRFYEMKDTSHIRIYERYGDVCTMTADGVEQYTRRRIYLADVGVDKFDQYGNIEAQHLGVELDNREFDGHPYWEFHAEKMPGRWLGIGVVETLVEPQIRQNEIANLQTKSSYWAALQLFQTRDESVNRNLLSDARNGEVINVQSEITKIDISDRNLAFFGQEEQKWMRNRDELTFSYDVVQGERLPAGTPLGSAQLAVSQTLSYFEGIQENVALDVKEMLYQVIIPRFELERSIEHTLRLVGQDLDQYIQMVKNNLVFKEAIRIAVNQGKVLTEQEAEAVGLAVEAAIKMNKEKIVVVPTGYYKDLKYDVDIDITGESIDTRVRSATMFAILQAISADPSMMEDPVKRKFLYTMGEDGGLNMADYLGAVTKSPADMVPNSGDIASRRAGGGVSAPALGGQMPGQQLQTV